MLQIQDIIHQALVSEDEIKNRLKHPFDTGYLKPRPELKIVSYTIAAFFLKNRQPKIIGIYGAPKTGKTILLWHTMTFVFKNHTREIYFFDVEKLSALNISPVQLADYLIEKLPDNKRLIVFDNAHFDKSWAEVAKQLHEKFEKTFVIFAGNQLLVTGITENIADKLYMLELPPLHFPTYLNLKYGSELKEHKQVAQALQAVLFQSKDAKQVIENLEQFKPVINSYFGEIVNLPAKLPRYLKYHNLADYLAVDSQDFALDRLSDSVEEAVFKNARLLGLQPTVLELMRKILYSNAVDPDGKQTGEMTRDNEIAQNALENLQLLQIFNTVYPFSRLNDGLSQYPARHYYYSPNLRMSLLRQLRLDSNELFAGKIYEDIIVQYLKQLMSDTVFYLPQEQGRSAFVIDDFVEKPVLVYFGDYEPETYGIDFRYKIKLSEKTTLPALQDDTVTLPLSWFLTLAGYLI